MSKVDRFWSHEARNIRCVREADYDALLAERDALKKDSERYQLLASTMVADCLGKDKTPQQAALFTTLNTITHVGTEAEFDAVFDAALQGEQP